MSASIKLLGVQEVYIDITEPFFGGTFTQTDGVKFVPWKKKEGTIHLCTTVAYKIFGLSNPDFEFQPEVTCVFELYPADSITEEDIYQTNVQTKEYLQSIIDTIYRRFLADSTIVLEQSSFDSLLPSIKKAMNQISNLL